MFFDTILLDADNTIFDFEKCEHTALRETLAGAGLPFDDDIAKSYSSINDALWKKLEQGIVTSDELRVRRFSELVEKCFTKMKMPDPQTLSEAFVSSLSRQTILIENTESYMSELCRHCEIYIITNGIAEVQRSRFDKSTIKQYVKKVYISGELGAKKPDSSFFDMVLNDLPQKDKSRIIVVGDSLSSDMQGGKNAGLTTCLFDPHQKVRLPHPLCDYSIDRLDGVLRLSSPLK